MPSASHAHTHTKKNIIQKIKSLLMNTVNASLGKQVRQTNRSKSLNKKVRYETMRQPEIAGLRVLSSEFKKNRSLGRSYKDLRGESHFCGPYA